MGMMTRPVGLRPALLVAGAYSVVIGFILLFPAFASTVFARPVPDPAVLGGWGTSIIANGILALGAASDTRRYGGLAPLFAVGLLVVTFGLLYYLLTGAYELRTVLVPLIVNTLLVAWIWSARPKE